MVIGMFANFSVYVNKKKEKQKRKPHHTATIFHKEEFYSCHFKEQFKFGQHPNVHAYHQIFSRTYSLLFWK